MSSIKEDLTEKIRGRLRKLLVVATDKRIRDGQKRNAKTLFDKLCAKHGIDPKTIRTDGFDTPTRAYLEVVMERRRIDAFDRAIAYLIAENFEIQIHCREFMVSNALMIFSSELPRRPDEAVRAFKDFKARLHSGWESLVKQWSERADTPLMIFVGAGMGAKPHKKSYVSGFYYTLTEILTRERAEREMFKRITEMAEERKKKKKKAPMLAAPPKWEAPPPNPLALAVIEKPKPRVEALEVPPKEEPPSPDGQQEDAPPPIEDLEDDNRLDQHCYSAGVRAARRIDLNAYKL
jgi:hypothetical protein